MGLFDWSTTPARNATADPTIRATDSASTRDQPGAVRAVMAGIAALAFDQGGALVSEGTDNIYVVSTASGISELRPGLMISFWADRDNTDEPFLNISGTGPRRWRGADGLSLPAGSVQRGLLYTVAWTGGIDGLPLEWRSVGAGGAGASTAGVAFDHSGSPAERAQYDAAPKGTTFLSVADTPQGPSWILYIKRSNGFGDWSTGLPIKASPAQATAEAQAAADAASQQAGVATAKATEASQAVSAASQSATLAAQREAAARGQAALAAGAATVATERAEVAGVAAASATYQAEIAGERADEADARSTAAASSAATASERAAAASVDALAALQHRTVSETARAASEAARAASGNSALVALAAASDAREAIRVAGLPVYDFNFESFPDPSDDWNS